jgi:hypothetical protein
MRIQGKSEDEAERGEEDDEGGAAAARGEEKATSIIFSQVATANSASSMHPVYVSIHTVCISNILWSFRN